MKYLVVTSFNTLQHWETFARGTLTSFVENLPRDCRIVAYTDGPKLQELETLPFRRVTNLNLEDFPEWQFFMEKFKGVQEPQGVPEGHKFRFKFRPFYSKVFAIQDAFERYNFDYLVWIDADVLIQKKLSNTWLNYFVNIDEWIQEHKECCSWPSDVAWLDRPSSINCEDTLNGWGTPDTGVMFLRNDPFVEAWVRDVWATYQTGLFLDMQEWHDAFIWKAILRYHEDDLLVKNLCENPHLADPILASPLSEFMVHMKGPMKHDPRINPQLAPKGKLSNLSLQEARDEYTKKGKKK